MDLFDQLRDISSIAVRPEREVEARERLVRLLDEHVGTGSERDIIDALCARLGLYPYMTPDREDLSAWEAFAIELHSPPELADDRFTFHADQQHVYSRLMDGESVVLSAPTSFGKSAIIDALVASHRWSNIVLLVPTIALIDETRRRLARYRDHYRLVTHPSESLGERNLIIMTQERFLEINELPDVDFFVIDEFYKLGAGAQKDSRRTLLNVAWSRLRRTGAQFYLLGPNVDDLDEKLPPELRERLIRSDFKPVAVDIDDRSSVTDQESDLLRLVNRDLSGSTLIFTGSPQKANGLGKLISSQRDIPAGFANQVADWIAENYDSEWDLVRALRGGVAVHTGPLPRGLQRVMVRLFDQRHVPIMVCTSTLIEGVNTAARNVVIFEKKIDGQLIDFFTFSNIRGRAGRMFQHFVGKVVTYMAPPEDAATIIDIPIESQSDLASEADLVQLDLDELSDTSRDRLSAILQQDALSLDVIRRNRGFDPELQIQAATTMAGVSDAAARKLSWSGRPKVEQAREVLSFAFHNLLEGSQRRGVNFNMIWGQLQNARVNAHDFSAQVDQQMGYARPGQSRNDIIETVLKFQRNWMGFTIPSMLRATQAVQGEVLAERGDRLKANYEYLLREVESLYLPFAVVVLEDYGLPTPLGLKLTAHGLRGTDLPEALESLLFVAERSETLDDLSGVERWILDDVVEGLGGFSSVRAEIEPM